MTNYIYVVKTFGIVFDSVTCSLAIFYSFLFTILEASHIYNLFIAIVGVCLLITNVLNYIKNQSNHRKVCDDNKLRFTLSYVKTNDILNNAYNISSG